MKRVKGNIWSDRYVYGIDYGDNLTCVCAQLSLDFVTRRTVLSLNSSSCVQ